MGDEILDEGLDQFLQMVTRAARDKLAAGKIIPQGIQNRIEFLQDAGESIAENDKKEGTQRYRILTQYFKDLLDKDLPPDKVRMIEEMYWIATPRSKAAYDRDQRIPPKIQILRQYSGIGPEVPLFDLIKKVAQKLRNDNPNIAFDDEEITDGFAYRLSQHADDSEFLKKIEEALYYLVDKKHLDIDLDELLDKKKKTGVALQRSAYEPQTDPLLAKLALIPKGQPATEISLHKIPLDPEMLKLQKQISTSTDVTEIKKLSIELVDKIRQQQKLMEDPTSKLRSQAAQLQKQINNCDLATLKGLQDSKELTSKLNSLVEQIQNAQSMQPRPIKPATEPIPVGPVYKPRFTLEQLLAETNEVVQTNEVSQISDRGSLQQRRRSDQ